MATYAKVRRMYYRERLPIREIARRTSLSRNTIKRWLHEPDRDAMTYQRPAAPRKIDAHLPWLHQALALDAQRPRKERRTALRLYAQLQEQGYAGRYAQLTEAIRRWRSDGGSLTVRHAFVPLAFEWGEAFQFDWSEESVVIGGVHRKVQLAHMKLCASRAFWLAAYPSQGHEMLFDAHTRCLAGLGGVPRRGIYDNMKTAVDRAPGRGKERVVNARFAALCAHYLIEPDFCNVASGWEKGRVEKGVQDTRFGLWAQAREESFASFAELNAWLAIQCPKAWAQRAHPEYTGMSIAEALEHEQAHLMPMPTPFDGYLEQPVRVSSTCLVRVQRNRYSVPCELAHRTVSARLYPERVVIVEAMDVVAEHARAPDRDHIVYDWRHYIPLIERKPGALRNGAPFADMPAPLRKLQQALLRRAGGDQVMAKVLTAVPRFGLEAVLVAVDLMLEAGAVSAEHVLNVLARLNEPPPPEPVASALTVREAPTTDTRRYDHLRALEVSHV
ncbi:IS21 family transposase [Burkholderia pseudomallei]|uniref:IS21 family transposase n=1 Tax=Burkholderia pseudomallei TaxID=28450 RepID=UPI0005B36847|nr:IS21 family transposase [Burkholderia pseudomallei]MCW0111774.1 IS21 family transposase [Burkholderia pseudomallei]